MLYQHVKTGARVKVVSEWDDGDWFYDRRSRRSRIYCLQKQKLFLTRRQPKRLKTLQVKDAAAQEEVRKFPPENTP